MSLYFTLLFAFLILEMCILFFIVLPLPNRIRKLVYNIWNKLSNKQEYRTVSYILWVIVGLLFIDSWKRANVPIHLHFRSSRGDNDVSGSGSTLDDPVTSIQGFATRAYNQRNVYISGFILYFMVVIPSIMSLIKRLIKYQDLIDKKNAGKPEELDKLQTGDKDLDELRDQLRKRQISLDGLRIQISNYEKHFDELVRSNSGNEEDPELKKTN
ncbi:hypothetical protein RI543_004870 [Arxiozyma heterogenica]|uniref:Endoplasmic reticulum transmembrane protein n=1 Tax=Arxiozyma heterogenica TaxID=278026 RepID=A0AAN7WG91_9SACH|nr:hypothetical protein RI543_004870 [Kazachstania heterogenica]